MGILLQLFAAAAMLAGIVLGALGFFELANAIAAPSRFDEVSAVQMIQLYNMAIGWFVGAIVCFVFAALMVLEHIAVNTRKN